MRSYDSIRETGFKMNLNVSRFLFIAGLFAFIVAAQLPTGQITGIVTDSTGANVAGAEVEAQNTSTGIVSKTVSNESGDYIFPVLTPGRYSVVVRKPGFESVTRSSIELTVSQMARIDFGLKVGSTREMVEVKATTPLLESATASLGQVIESKAVSDLPLNGRNFLQLAKLSTGVLEPKQGDRGAAGGSFIANGVRAQLNNFLLDGVDNNAKILDQQNSSPVAVQPSVDAVQEFKVETNNYSAEYGYSAGAVVNASLKGGGNTIHGDAFEFVRNRAFDARNYFASPTQPKPALQRNQYGGTLGGALVKNKAFLFGSFEQTRENNGITYVTTVPTAAMKGGNLGGLPAIFDPNTTVSLGGGVFKRTQFAGNQIPTTRFDPAAVKLLALFPSPTSAGNSNNYTVSQTQNIKTNRFDFRHDLQLSEKDNLFARYSYFTYDYRYPGPFEPPLLGSTTFQNSVKATTGNAAGFGETHSFSPRVVNEFRAGYNRIEDVLTPWVQDYIDDQYGLGGIPRQPGVAGLPSITISGVTTIGEATFLPNSKISETTTLQDNLSFQSGNHSLKFGGSYRFVRSYFSISNNARGNYTFSGGFTQDPQNRGTTGSALGDFVLGIPSTSSISNFTQGDIRYRYWGGFIQDDWKATSKLTINAGVRYELWTQPVERHNSQANFFLADRKLAYAFNNIPAGVPASVVESVPLDIDTRSLLKTSHTNFAPRLGFAYQVTPSMVLRGGAGIFYADSPFVGASGRLVANPPYAIANSYPTDNITPILKLSTGFPASAVTSINFNSANLVTFAPDLRNGDVYHWSFGIQKQAGQYVFDVNYVGTRSLGLPLGYNVNQALAGPGSVASRRPYQGFNDISKQVSMGYSRYNALEARAERRYSNGLGLLVSYTYSKSLDNGGEQLIGDLSLRNVNNVDQEYSLSSGDMRHRFVSSVLYDLPFGHGRRLDIRNPVLNAVAGGWQLNTIVTVHTGQPFTPILGVSSANTGAARPSVLRNPNLPSDRRTVQNWFDKTAFYSPTPFQYGDAGRDIIIGPGAANVDFSTFKGFSLGKLREGVQLQIRAEFFNFFNHPQFGQLGQMGNQGNRVDTAQGSAITTLSTPMRQMQFGVKLLF
jgi:hypothetical protein